MCSIISLIIAVYWLYSAVMYVYCIVSIIQYSMILKGYDAYYVSGLVSIVSVVLLPYM